MTTSLLAPETRVEPRVRPTPARAHPPERSPFLRQAGVETGACRRPRIGPPASGWRLESDARAREVLEAFAGTGGIASADEVTLMLRRRSAQPISMLARWIVARRVVSFRWHGEHLLPLFQFDRTATAVRTPVLGVLEELDGTFEDWDLATWFALPNAWLGDRAPVHVLDDDPHAMLQAARADRFIARG